MKYFRFFLVVIACHIGLFFLYLPFSTSQDIPVEPAENAFEPEQIEPLTIKLSVNEIRLDVVVLDRDGNPITDLTAADFDVSQNNRRMEIKSSVYIDSQSDGGAQSAAARKDALNYPSSPPLKAEDVRRSIIFLVDDYAMTLDNGYHAKMALRNFVEKQMQPGDMVSVVGTAYGNSALNMFHSDKREMLARINAIPPTMAPRPFNERTSMGVHEGMWQHFMDRSHENRISALSYGIRSLENMPGRKIIILVTPLSVHEDPSLRRENIHDKTERTFLAGMPTLLIVPPRIDTARLKRYEELYRRLADEALRAGTLVNILDVDGLNNFGDFANPDYSMDYAKVKSMKPPGAPTVEEMLTSSWFQNEEGQTGQMRENPMPSHTGGITIRNSNFFLDGVGRDVESLMRGYYLISYEPPPDTFETRGKQDVFHNLRVRVNRGGAKVHTRSGFFNRLESQMDADTPENPLLAAIYSPFQATDLNVNVAAGYVKDVEAGYLVRSWIHLDPKDVKIAETEDGGARIDIETLCVTSDVSGNVQDSKAAQFTLTISPENKSENLAWIQKHGVRFSMLLPVKKPGAYYVQVSIQDKESGRVGSAYQFLEIPDVGKRDMALSNVFMITSTEDLGWMLADVKKELSEGVFLPVFQGEVRSPALRTLVHGDNLISLGMLYNADARALAKSEIVMQSVLYKDGAEFRRGESMPITPDNEKNPNGVPILQRMTIGSDMPPGDYVLQLVVANKRNNKNQEGNTTQFLHFTVAEK